MSGAAAVMMMRSKGACSGQPVAAVAALGGDVVETEPDQAALRLPQERPVPLDAVDATRQPRQHRRLVARAGADLQHLVARLHLQRLRHQGHHLRLAQRLPEADRQRAVLVGLIEEGRRHESLPRDSLDRPQHRACR
jgi:hypothetical protein